MSDSKEPSIARNLGSFFGHIVKAIKTDTSATERVRVSQSKHEEHKPDGVILRRTTVDEVVLPPNAPKPPNDG